MRTKKELDDMKGMFLDLRAFPPFPDGMFLSVTSGEVDSDFDHITLEHWPKNISESNDGFWRDYYTGEKLEKKLEKKLENYNETRLEQMVGGMHHCAKVRVGDSNESLNWKRLPCSQIVNGTKILCSCLQKKTMLLRGLCSSSNLKTRYDLNQNSYNYWLQHLPESFDKVFFVSQGHFGGVGDYRIDYNMTSSQWILSSTKFQTTAVSLAGKDSYLMGKHNWTVSNDDQRCHLEKGKDKMENYTIELKMSGCEQGYNFAPRGITQNDKVGEFTCNDGQCVSMTKRCNQLPDCDDGSDEKGCRLFSLVEGYNKVVSPFNISDLDETFVKVPINVSLKLLKMFDIDERENTIDLQFQIILEWRDPRITFNNLKENVFFNFLTEEEVKMIWLPVLTYDNTDQKETTRLGEYGKGEWSTTVEVSRDGKFTRQVLDLNMK